ncbi:hypothetical protein ON010_g8608 [Phytophthora cinnamomi]|nr:hypothetical protein ON010_g8608 [Phytophthora cinnamomi]
MFLQKLLDPEDEQRRRVRRARIVRRNRIKREVAQGLPVRHRRVPKASDYVLNLDEPEEWTESKSPFRPTFGGESSQLRQTMNQNWGNAQQSAPSPTKSLFSSATNKPRSSVTNAPLTTTEKSASLASVLSRKSISRSMTPHIKARWQEVFQQVVFKRHEEILAKDPNRKWRQERFGLLLFARREYARASEHLDKAVSLGANSSLCWRRLAESYYHMWKDGGEWEVLWACRAAYEQALNHLEVACSPIALFMYARVLELLGSYTGALTICASILQTFPRFEHLREVKLRFVLLQRYQLFSLTSETSSRLAVLRKCTGYTQELLLDTAIIEGPRHLNVLYLHTRLNEMLAELSTLAVSEPQGQTPTIAKPKLAQVSVDILFQELYKLAVKTPEVAPPPGVRWKPWRDRSETYTAFAEYFRAQGDNILASDALSRSLELLETLPPESNSSGKSTNLWRGLTEEQRHQRIALYLVLARNYYQCNQMEKAIRSMEAVFDLDPLHAEARASLVEWFPAKWQYRLELEDASQVQIARVLRGIWDRNRALLRRREVIRAAENKYRENPYHLGYRRKLLRLLRDKYASLFAAQDLAARSIQRGARRYLYYARMRWKKEDQREKTLRELVSATPKANTRRGSTGTTTSFETNWQPCYPTNTSTDSFVKTVARFVSRHSSLIYVIQAEASEQRRTLLEQSSVLKIQRLWRRYTAGKTLGGRVNSQAHVFLVEHLFAAQRRQTTLGVDLDRAARKIQAVYRGKLMRHFLQLLRGRVLAPPCASPIGTLIAKCERNHQAGTETMAVLHSIDNLDEKRSLFDHPVLVLRGAHLSRRPESPSTNESFSLQHVVSAIQYSAVLKCLICASGDFKGHRILTLFQALQTRRNLRVLALGEISTAPGTGSPSHEQSEQLVGSSLWSSGDNKDKGALTPSSSPLGRRLLALPSPPSSPQPHQKRQLSAMHTLSKALCTSNFLLEELYFERNSLLVRPQEGAALAGIVADYFFARYGHLHTLVVAHMRFSDESGALLGAALAINTVLRKLDLHGNLLSDGAAIAIANDGLPHNTSLRYLNLAENTIGSVGGKALFKCLGTSNRSLQTLILRNNHLMSDVMLLLIEAWQTNAVIDSVELAGNLINERYLQQFQAATTERREVTPAKENHELRLLLARKRFGFRDTRSLVSRRGIGIFSTPVTSPGKRSGLKTKMKGAPLSPKKWLSANTPKIVSPIAFPTSMDSQANEVYAATMFSVENAYAPARPRKLLKASSPARLISPSKLPALSTFPGKKRVAW